ncbi:hypothetical protein [Algoriphagus antarcticus]|uniref:Uncharacterized protein n=1 Tax=Algoriphagus antarcticus TaxID=238540 RepID=A0A3E0DWZ2_9BACT|nr:hypothetical protein [Algoriphagus antarcticus]REG90558.1 hypothetical protein C8N25_10656 [Algoriphagus antarcticus]
MDYLSGLTDEQYNQANANAGEEMSKLWGETEKLNEGGTVLFDGKEISQLITKPEILGNLNKYISKDEIWFSLNFSEAEKDYSVIYKTRLVAK